MTSERMRLWSRILGASFVIFTVLFPVFGQDDTDPNSPTPILISEEGSTRALATTPAKIGRTNLAKIESQAFRPESKVVLYVTNIELMKGEGANAFRVYAESADGRTYRYPVTDIKPSDLYPGVFALTFELKDQYGFWEPPTYGDVLLSVTWRGLVSNRVKLGYGSMGGNLPEDELAKPTPLDDYVFKTPETPTSDYVGARAPGDRVRFMEQATFGPTQALDNWLKRFGIKTWLNNQFEMPYPSAANPYPNLPLKPINAPADCDGEQTTVPDVPVTCARDTYTMYPIQAWFYKEAFYGEPQLRHRVNWALSQIWVISGFNGDTQQASHMIAYHQLLNKNAFGNWRTLMTDMTLNPGMGNYLDMMRSTRTSPNENYPREVLQLFNIGLFMLNQDGTVQTDGQGIPIPTYDQNTVNNFTKVFTGWRDCRAADFNASCPNALAGTVDYKDPMTLATANHDLTAKTLLTYPGSTTTNIAACSGCTTAAQIGPYANNSLNQALDNIYNHPNVAPFVSKLLIQQLVTSDPTPAYVGRVAAVFNANRSSQTQLKEVIRAILLDPEARGDVKTDPRYGKLREPVQLLTNVLRNFNVASADLATQSDGNVNRFVSGLGQDAFRSTTVFNYYSPDYVVPGTTLLAPEFNIYTTSTSIGRANLFNLFAFSQVNISNPDTPTGTRANFTDLAALAAADTTSNRLLDHLNTRMMHGTMSAKMKSTIQTAVNAVASSSPLTRAQTAVYLIATSSQFQVQR
ncbi:MAG: DUF1800 family protein [Acidobacteria bacterium]|nr:DUF1800 family protein [Acidobacteriota bacterium]